MSSLLLTPAVTQSDFCYLNPCFAWSQIPLTVSSRLILIPCHSTSSEPMLAGLAGPCLLVRIIPREKGKGTWVYCVWNQLRTLWLVGIPATSCHLCSGFSRIFRKGARCIPHRLRLSRLVYSEGLPFSKNNLELKQNITSKAERYTICQLGRYRPPGYGLAVRWLHVLLLGLGMAAKCAVGSEAN